jgi:nucleoside-diphosphate-sugar epimerase
VNILIIGGTRNLGHAMALALLGAGHRVSILNRGVTPDELPREVERLHGDRSDPARLKALLAGRRFDAVLDTTLYSGADAKVITKLLAGQTGHYLFLSSGQVYLVREELARPFREEDYPGRLLPAPPAGIRDFEEWEYGISKREVEDHLFQEWEAHRFPLTTLRLPMVNSERDHFHRILSYLLRLRDGGPILVPAGKHLALRHVDGQDVVKAILKLVETGPGRGRVYNLSQNETVSIDEFLNRLASLVSCPLRLARIDSAILEEAGLIPVDV